MNAIRTSALEAHGGAIPTARLIPLINRFEEGNDYDRENDSLARRVYKVRYEAETVSFDFADRLLIDMGMKHEWHSPGELADLYEVDVLAVAAADRLYDACPDCGGRKQRDSARCRACWEQSRRRFSPREARALWALYQSGLSLAELARRIHRTHGFDSPKSCEQALMRTLNIEGKRRRDAVEAKALWHQQNGCAGCGCAMDERSHGCHRCHSRHYLRKCRGHQPFVVFRRENCFGCGVPHAERTRGCRQCIDRHWKRTKRGPAKDGVEALSPSASAVSPGSERRATTSIERKAA